MSEAGGPGWGVKGPVRASLLVLAVGVVGALTWAAGVEIHGAVIAPGQVAVAAGQQVIQHPEGGRVTAIAVRNGTRVAAGAALLELDATVLSAEQAVLDRQWRAVRARVDRLDAEARAADAVVFRDASAAADDPAWAAVLAAEREGFALGRAAQTEMRAEQAQRRAATEAYLAGRQRQLAAIREQLILLEAEIHAQTRPHELPPAPRGPGARLRREAARLYGVRGQVEADLAQGQRTLAADERGQQRLWAERRAQAQAEWLMEQAREAGLAAQRRVVADRLARRVLRAPLAGVVHGLRVETVGGVIPAGAVVATIVPEEGPLVLRSRVAAAQIDEVRVGQAVTVRFPAFSRRTASEFAGLVHTVSADALDEEAGGDRYYMAEITLSGAAARSAGLVPGMPGEAFIQTRARTPLAFLLDPLTAYLRHAFREE